MVFQFELARHPVDVIGLAFEIGSIGPFNLV
jgi:hypothetical protein